MEKFKAVCPTNSNHTWFIVREDSGQTWLADAKGRAVELLSGAESMPGFEDFWFCRTCGVEAKFTEMRGEVLT